MAKFPSNYKFGAYKGSRLCGMKILMMNMIRGKKTRKKIGKMSVNVGDLASRIVIVAVRPSASYVQSVEQISAILA